MKRLLREFLNSVLIVLGIFSACMGLKGFLLSSNFIDGGVTGVSMLLAKTTGLPLAVLLPLVFVLHGIDEYTAITIISNRNAAIRDKIMTELGRGVTVYKGYGGKSGAEQDILYCVVTRLEIGKVKTIVRELDGSAFVVFHPLAGVEGGLVKKIGLH